MTIVLVGTYLADAAFKASHIVRKKYLWVIKRRLEVRTFHNFHVTVFEIREKFFS